MKNLAKQSNKHMLFGFLSIVCSGLFGTVAMADHQDGAANEVNGDAKSAVYIISSSATAESKPAKDQAKPKEKDKSEIGAFTTDDGARQGAYGDGEYAN